MPLFQDPDEGDTDTGSNDTGDETGETGEVGSGDEAGSDESSFENGGSDAVANLEDFGEQLKEWEDNNTNTDTSNGYSDSKTDPLDQTAEDDKDQSTPDLGSLIANYEKDHPFGEPLNYESLLPNRERIDGDSGASLRAADPNTVDKSPEELEAEMERELAEAALEKVADKAIETAIETILESGLKVGEFAAEVETGVITGVFESKETAPPELDDSPRTYEPAAPFHGPGCYINPIP